jgi:AbrB family looped-hinge helix DNA binding protein
MTISLVASKGQTTIPKKIREHLHLKPGDKVDFVIEDNGRVLLEPSTLDIKDLEGLLHRPGRKAVSIEEMKDAIRKRFKGKKAS